MGGRRRNGHRRLVARHRRFIVGRFAPSLEPQQPIGERERERGQHKCSWATFTSEAYNGVSQQSADEGSRLCRSVSYPSGRGLHMSMYEPSTRPEARQTEATYALSSSSSALDDDLFQLGLLGEPAEGGRDARLKGRVCYTIIKPPGLARAGPPLLRIPQRMRVFDIVRRMGHASMPLRRNFINK